MANKKNKKAKKKVAKKKKISTSARRIEVVVRTQSAPLPAVIPTTQELAEPIKSDGGKLTIPKTWLSSNQIQRMVEKTPAQYIYKRPGKGGKEWDYVAVSYVQRLLDYIFGFNWDFTILEHGREQDHVWVRGRLTVRDPANKYSIVKEQFGRSEVKHKQGSKELLDYGNDLKAASSDALKKCASMLGIARDIYGKTDYKAESGKTPRETPPQGPQAAVDNLKDKYTVEPDHSHDTPGVTCKGPNRKGCQYGNDVEPLPERVASYSKKVYGLELCQECQKDAKPLKK